MPKKIVLAYSGGLDTSVAIPWLKERFEADVIAVTVDVGQGRELKGVREKALATGAIKALVIDGVEPFVTEFVWPALRAGAMYEGVYPLATALARPLIAQYLIEVALKEKAYAIAHGCTGKGNDQVRFDVSAMALAPELHVIAPAREWGMSREEEIEYAVKHGVPIPVGRSNPFSIDENLWGRSIEAGSLEDAWVEPTEEAYSWTCAIENTPEKPKYVEITFRRGIPIAVDGEEIGGVEIIQYLNRLAGEHGVGRIDHVENRLVGIKSREIYEAPAAILLHVAHRALETITLSKEQQRFKEQVASHYADLVYNGFWYSAHRDDLQAYIDNTQRYVNGVIRMKLHRGTCAAVGRKSPYALYKHELATYDKDDQFDHEASEGFIKVYGLPLKTQARTQRDL